MKKMEKHPIAMSGSRNFKLFFFVCMAWSTLFAGEGVEKLKAGNQRYLNEKLEHCITVSKQRAITAETQKPFAVILGCADSRVPPEVIFDQAIGELFTVRVAGNVAGPLEMDSIEYGTNVLGAQTILVLGHENCGAVKAVLAGKASIIEAVEAKITPNLKQLKEPVTVEEAVKANARAVAKGLESSDILSDLIKAGKLEITCGYYHFATGEVEFYKP